jgi:hypothetical protein
LANNDCRSLQDKSSIAMANWSGVAVRTSREIAVAAMFKDHRIGFYLP